MELEEVNNPLLGGGGGGGVRDHQSAAAIQGRIPLSPSNVDAVVAGGTPTSSGCNDQVTNNTTAEVLMSRSADPVSVDVEKEPSCLPDSVLKWKNEHQKAIMNCFKVLSLFVFRVSLYLYDLVTDITLIDDYYKKCDSWYFGLTLTFVVVPALLIFCINAYYYYEKWTVKRQIKKHNDEYRLKENLIVDPLWKFIIRLILCLPLIISPIARCKQISLLFAFLEYNNLIKIF